MSADVPQDEAVTPPRENPAAQNGIENPPPKPLLSFFPPDNPPSIREKYCTCHSTNEFREWGKFVVEVLTLIAVVCYASVARRQLTEMQDATIAAKDGAAAATSAANTAAAALASSQQQFRIEQRPYIWAYPVTGPNNLVLPSLGQSIFIRVDFKNSGRTPATRVVATHSTTIVAPKKEARRQAREFVAKYPVIPGSVQPPEVIVSAPTGIGPNLTDKMLINIKNGTWEIYVVGAIKYTDIFQPPINPYETTYCFSFNPTGLPFGGCDWGGDSFK